MLATLECGAAVSEGGLDRSLLKPMLSEDLDVEPPAPPGRTGKESAGDECC